jgi:acetyl esterase/lipase
MLSKRLIGASIDPSITIDEMRLGLEKATKFSFLPTKTKVDQVVYNNISAEWISSKNANEENVVLYLHGGGYNLGSPLTHREFAAHMSNASRAKVLLPDYRLAPENPFPAALEDAIASYQYLLDNGYATNKIAIAGESAGGSLTLATCLSLRDQNKPLPSSLTCLSPWTDLEMTGNSIRTLADIDPIVKLASVKMQASNYIGTNDPKSPFISPIHADFTDFPPILIHVGSDEMLLDDSKRVANKARQAGVNVTLKIYDEMWHFFHVFYRLMPEAKAATKEVGMFIQKNCS